MLLKYSLVLNALDVVLWKLRYPIVVSTDYPIQLLVNLRLLIISDVLISLNDFFIEDVIRTLHLKSTEIYIITMDSINRLVFPLNRVEYCWLMGVKMSCKFCCITFYTPSLSILKCNTDAKRDLWYQIHQYCKY